jgi:D-hydroxyproline dehydrogenase subunit gamma
MLTSNKTSDRRIITFTFDGVAVSGEQGASVAAALLASGRSHFRRTPVSGALRGPYCLMGVCFDCLVSIDGVGNQQACLIALRAGMRVETQDGKREAGK